jgi:hypothetical protein
MGVNLCPLENQGVHWNVHDFGHALRRCSNSTERRSRAYTGNLSRCIIKPKIATLRSAGIRCSALAPDVIFGLVAGQSRFTAVAVNQRR